MPSEVKLAPFLDEMSGTLGDLYCRKTRKKGEAVLAKRPSPAQKAHWARFTEAAAYATAALTQPELRAHYEAEAQRLVLQPGNVAMADYLSGKNLLSK